MSDLPAFADPWRALRQLTPARIALGRVGSSLPTHELLDFQWAHARARDAVHQPFDAGSLCSAVRALGWAALMLSTAVTDRRTYLERPDLGRRLDDASRARLTEAAADQADLAIIVSDGLSALAAQRQAIPLLSAWGELLRASQLRLAPICIVPFARVAVQDEVGGLLRARSAVILLGERPGLGSPDSLGAYLVHGPRPGRTDAERNCISNIRPEGLPPAVAAERLHRLTMSALRTGISGVGLREDGPLLAQ
jgi:ethanolamine ammonia-lyase small subunit